MDKIVDLHLSFMNRLIEGEVMLRELVREGISILPGFMEQHELVRSYYRKFYSKSSQRIVLCGINPGRHGAGKTGVPFIDFSGISHLMPGYGRLDLESSAQFMLSIIEEYGEEAFPDAVYLTNVSWYGFKQDGKNKNYYELPSHLKRHFTASFLEEMQIVQPSAIVPLSKEVDRTLRQMVVEGQLNFPVVSRLPHPFNCSFKSKVEPSRKLYCKVIEQHTRLQRKEASAAGEPLPHETIIKSNVALPAPNTEGFKSYLRNRHLTTPSYKPLSDTSVKQYHNRLENLIRYGIYNGEPELTPEMKKRIDGNYKDTSGKYSLTIRYYIEYIENENKQS